MAVPCLLHHRVPPVQLARVCTLFGKIFSEFLMSISMVCLGSSSIEVCVKLKVKMHLFLFLSEIDEKNAALPRSEMKRG